MQTSVLFDFTWCYLSNLAHFCASFAQVSLGVMVRFNTSLPDRLSLSGANEAHMAFFSHDKRQAKPGILRAQLPGNAAERAFGTGDERRGFNHFARAMSVLFHVSSNCCRDIVSCVVEMASRFTGSPRLSQTAQRVASGR